MGKTLILNKIKEYKNFKSDADFARFLEIPAQNLSKWKARNTYDIEILYTKCPELNPEWLLTGQGEMLKNVPAPESAPQESHSGADRYTASLEKQIALLEKNNALQERENTYLLEKIKNLQEVEKEAQTPCDEIKIIAEERASIIDMQKDKIEMQNKIIEDLELKLQKFKKEEKSIEKHSETPTLLEI